MAAKLYCLAVASLALTAFSNDSKDGQQPDDSIVLTSHPIDSAIHFHGEKNSSGLWKQHSGSDYSHLRTQTYKIDPMTAKDVARAFEEALAEEEPLLKAEEARAAILRKKPVARAHLRKSSSLVPEVEAAPATPYESGEWASEFERDMSDLVMGLSKGQMGATNMSGSVAKIAVLLEKDMMPKVLAAHKANQDELNKFAKDISACKSTKESEMQAAGKREAAYKHNSKIHKSCRGEEAALFTENINCQTKVNGAKTVKDLKCKAYLEASQKYGETTKNKKIVTKAGSEDIASYLLRITKTICGDLHKGGKGGFYEEFIKHKKRCERATKKYNGLVVLCKSISSKYSTKKKQCDSTQSVMDDASCKWATEAKDACQTYDTCWTMKVKSYSDVKKTTHKQMTDRKGEWRGLKRMGCLIEAFSDGEVKDAEVAACKNATHSTDHLNITYGALPQFGDCTVPELFPSTAAYKQAEFVPLPTLAKGNMDANECTGLTEIPTIPAIGSPSTCKCTRVVRNGNYDPGPLVSCTGCNDVSRTTQKNSCPAGTKIFSPRDESDWMNFVASLKPLRSPNWIIDVTRPQNGCGDCNYPKWKNSGWDHTNQPHWGTSDGSPWWLRSATWMYSTPYLHSDPHGDYQANCYLDVWNDVPEEFFKEGGVKYNGGCGYHSNAYYCQLAAVSTKPQPGSPSSCTCKRVELNGPYSADVLLKCTGCLDVSKSAQKNSCPKGTKIFSPASRADWKTIIKSVQPLRSPHWIIDVTRPQNGCGGCTTFSMNYDNAAQKSWKTSDGSPWWLRSTRYSEPNGDYQANCYLDLWKNPSTENAVTFNDWNCKYHSNSYYCQTVSKWMQWKATAHPLDPNAPISHHAHTFVLNPMPRMHVWRNAATLTSKMWPSDYCVDFDLTFPEKQNTNAHGYEGTVAILGKIDFVVTHTKKLLNGTGNHSLNCSKCMGLMAIIQGDAKGPYFATTGLGMPGTRHAASFCYKESTNFAEWLVDGKIVAADYIANKKVKFPATRDVPLSLLTGSHSNDNVEPLKGGIVHDFMIKKFWEHPTKYPKHGKVQLKK